MGRRVPDRDKNVLIHIIGEALAYFEKTAGFFGPLSFKLVLGLTLGISSLLLFAKLSEDLLFNELFLFDQIITGIVRWPVSPGLTEAMVQISNLGSPWVLVGVGIAIMLYTGVVRRHLWDTILIPTALGGGIILNEALKLGFQRIRPGLPHLMEAAGYSFPSGHSMMSFVFYGILIYLLWINIDNRLVRFTLALIMSFIILAVGISRIYLGVHYPSDVLAGFAAGSFWLVACILGLRGIRYHKAGNKKPF